MGLGNKKVDDVLKQGTCLIYKSKLLHAVKC